jgi:putative transposase
MGYDPGKHHRRSIRLAGYDYSLAGAYFVTIITHNKVSRFGKVIAGEMHLNRLGEITERKWLELESRFPFLKLDEYVLMPNHLHGILVITCKGAAGSSRDTGNEDAQLRPSGQQKLEIAANSLAVIVRSYKSSVSRWFNGNRFYHGETLWHRNYYEHIIRNEQEWEQIRLYIQTNPANWLSEDEYFTDE